MRVYRFEDFELDPQRFELRRSGEPVSIEGRVLDLLLLLIRNRERVVSARELFDEIWPGVAVSPGSLQQAVYAARRALGDDSRAPRFLKTVRGRGVRFVGEVVEGRPRRSGHGAAVWGPGGSPPFVGRLPLLGELEEALEDASCGQGRVVLLEGEPGIGKTRIVEEFGRRVRAAGVARVHLGRCLEDEGAPAYWPWLQLLRAAAGADHAGRNRSFGKAAPRLGALAPELAWLEGGEGGHRASDPGPARYRLFDATARFWLEAALRAPRVLVLDDLHRADEPSWLLLRYLAREVGHSRLLVLGTFRDAELHASPRRGEILAELVREPSVQPLQVHGFSLEEAAELLGAATGVAPPDAIARDLHERSGGNPFFLSHLARLVELGPAQEWTVPDRSLPRTLREAIGRQLDGLDAGCQRLLERAAVIGRDFDATTLAALAQAGPTGPAERLGPALEAGIVCADGSRPGRYRFSHVLVRDALYESLGAPARARLHGLVAEALEASLECETPERLAELAHHFVAASPVCGPAKAVAYAARAGRAASASLAFEEAAAHYERALLAAEGSSLPPADRCDLLLALGEAQTRAGNRDAARSTFRAAAALAKDLGQPERLARVALAVAPGFFAIEVGVFDAFTVSLLEESLRLLPEEETPLRARLLARLGMALYWSDSLPRRQALIEEAERISQSISDPATSAYVLGARIMALWGPDNVEERVSQSNLLAQNARQLGEGELAAVGSVFSIASSIEIFGVAAIPPKLHLLESSLGAAGVPQLRWYPALYKSLVWIEDGDLDRGIEAVRELLQAGRKSGDINVELSFAACICAVYWHKERGADLISSVRSLVERHPAVTPWRAAFSLMCCQAGEELAARRELDRLAAHGFAYLHRDMFWLPTLALLAETALCLRHSRYLATLYGLLLPYERRIAVIGYGVVTWGSIARTLGNLAMSIGKPHLGERHLKRAIEIERASGHQLWLARSQLDYARLMIARGRSADAGSCRRLAASSHGLFKSFGLERLAERAQKIAELAGQHLVGAPEP